MNDSATNRNIHYINHLRNKLSIYSDYFGNNKSTTRYNKYSQIHFTSSIQHYFGTFERNTFVSRFSSIKISVRDDLKWHKNKNLIAINNSQLLPISMIELTASGIPSERLTFNLSDRSTSIFLCHQENLEIHNWIRRIFHAVLCNFNKRLNNSGLSFGPTLIQNGFKSLRPKNWQKCTIRSLPLTKF